MSPPAAPLLFLTGASSGLGQALALHYHRAGWRLALVVRRPESLQPWLDTHGLGADRVAVYAADVRDPEQIRAAGRACLAAQGLPDVVIANAGISHGVDLAEAEDLQVLRDIFDTNVLGLAATFQPFIGPMRQARRGTLVGIASVAGIRGLPGHAAYTSSKSAVITLCESLRVELRPQGVRVVTLLPGYVDTRMTRGNPFPMPFLIRAEQFAERAARAIAGGRRWRVIPWQMGVVAWLLRAVPRALWDRAMARAGRKPRATGPGR